MNELTKIGQCSRCKSSLTQDHQCSMNPPRPNEGIDVEKEAQAASVCPPEDHEEWRMTWRHQGDGFNYYRCERCGWQKPDLESPVFTRARAETEAVVTKRERDRIRPLIEAANEMWATGYDEQEKKDFQIQLAAYESNP